MHVSPSAPSAAASSQTTGQTVQPAPIWGKHDLFDRFESNVHSYCRDWPTTFATARGSRLADVDGRTYLDFFAGCTPRARVSPLQRPVSGSDGNQRGRGGDEACAQGDGPSGCPPLRRRLPRDDLGGRCQSPTTRGTSGSEGHAWQLIPHPHDDASDLRNSGEDRS